MKYFICDENKDIVGEVKLYDTKVQKPVDKEGKTIALVIGHDSIKQGAYGNAGMSEFNFNTDLINSMELPPQHTYYILYRDEYINGYTSQMNDLHERIDSLNCDISIEFHFNGSSNPDVNGNEVLYYSQGGKEIASLLDSSLDRLPNRDRGIKQLSSSDNGYSFVSKGASLAIIAEPFFGSNQSDYMNGGEYRDLLKEAYYDFLNVL